MAPPLKPAEIFQRAADEGKRRLDQGMLQLVATGFIAGFTIVFGIIAQGAVDAMAHTRLGEMAGLLGALAFGIGIVFLIIGKAELFSENFFDPIAAFFEAGDHRESGMILRLARLWIVTLVLNLVGGALLVVILSVEGALPSGAPGSLNRIAEEVAHRAPLATFVRAIIGGALVALLSFLTLAADHAVGRILMAYFIGVLLALGPFEHIVVSLLHLGFGFMLGAKIESSAITAIAAITLAGNLLGGVGLVTLSHAAQAKGAGTND